MDSWVAAGIRNPVVLTGDIHSHWAADIRRRWDDPAGADRGHRAGDVLDLRRRGRLGERPSSSAGLLAENPHVRFFNNRRGYVRTRITDTELTADFRVLPYVQRRGAPVETRATFVIEDRRPGLNRA